MRERVGDADPVSCNNTYHTHTHKHTPGLVCLLGFCLLASRYLLGISVSLSSCFLRLALSFRFTNFHGWEEQDKIRQDFWEGFVCL